MASLTNEIFWREFFDIYRSLSEVWKIKSEEYKNKNKKNAAYGILLSKMQEYDPSANLDTLKSKINSLRGCYRRELKKKRMSEKSGAGVDDVYTPSLWYFRELSFLEDQESQETGISTIEIEEREDDIHKEENTPPLKKTRRDFGRKERNELLIKAAEALNEKRAKDETSTFSSTWEVLFRKLEPSQQLFANKTIMEVLYQGALGRLHENSYKLLENEPTRKRVPSRINFASLQSTYNESSSTSSTFGQSTSQKHGQNFNSTPVSSPVEFISVPVNSNAFFPTRKVFTIQQQPTNSNIQEIANEECEYHSFSDLLNDSEYS